MIVAPLPDPRSSTFLDAWTRRWGIVGASLIWVGILLGWEPPRWPTVPYGIEFVWGGDYSPGGGAGVLLVPLVALVAVGACVGTVGRARAFLLFFAGLGYIVVLPVHDAVRDAIRSPEAWPDPIDFLWSHKAFFVFAALAGVGISAGNRVRRLRPNSSVARTLEFVGGAVLPVAVLLQFLWHRPWDGERLIDCPQFSWVWNGIPIVYVHEGLVIALSLLGIAGALREDRVTRRARLLGKVVVATPILWFLFLDVAWGAAAMGWRGLPNSTVSEAIRWGCEEIGEAMRLGTLYTGGWMICSVGLVAIIETSASRRSSARAIRSGLRTLE